MDYDPLPFTQGVVTHNFTTDSPKESAIEFVVDGGYPSPTNDNYLDPNAARWGMAIDPAQPGRVANGAYTQCFYSNVIQTNRDGAYKVYLTSAAHAQSLQPGDHWCMISRWNGSIVFNTFESDQVTYLSNTIYSGAGASYTGERSPLISQINDRIQPGPPPPGATAARLRASNADGGLFGDSRIGPWVQGCQFSGLSDDAANACFAPFIVTNVPVQPTNTLALSINTTSAGVPTALVPFQVEAGDTIDFFNATNGVVFDRATVTAVNLPNVIFDHSISNLVAGTYVTNTMLLNETLNSSGVYLDNQFINCAFHGIYCRANNLLIAHNTIGGMGKNAICAFPAITQNFLNFFVPTNVVILNNVLFDEGFSYEALHNATPTDQPAYAMVDLHKADLTSNYVAEGLEISGIRILYNAFVNGRRVLLALRNATDVNVIGNYFGPPLTNDGLVALTNNVVADLWACDYPNLRFGNNVNATTLPDDATINEDGAPATVPAKAFEPLVDPQLSVNRSGVNLEVSWTSPSPGFVLQQVGRLDGGTPNWTDVTNRLWLAGASNLIMIALPSTATNQFYQARQR